MHATNSLERHCHKCEYKNTVHINVDCRDMEHKQGQLVIQNKK